MSEVLEFARETARRAGELLVDFSRRPFAVGSKSAPGDLVTDADVAAERLIIDAIRGRFPDHAILSEEGLGGGALTGPAPVWLVDPLDGTVNYAHHFPVWSVSVALAEAGRVVAGAVFDPLRDEMFWAAQGQGAWLNGQRLRVSGAATLGESLLTTGFPHRTPGLASDNLAEFTRVAPLVHGVRRPGSAALDLACVAAGRLEGYWEFYLSPWDWAAGGLLVEEAGGRLTMLDGRAWTLDADSLVASNGRIHSELVAVLAGDTVAAKR